VRRIEGSFERSPRKSTRRASRELGIPQPTVWSVLRHRLLFNWVHSFESSCISILGVWVNYFIIHEACFENINKLINKELKQGPRKRRPRNKIQHKQNQGVKTQNTKQKHKNSKKEGGPCGTVVGRLLLHNGNGTIQNFKIRIKI